MQASISLNRSPHMPAMLSMQPVTHAAVSGGPAMHWAGTTAAVRSGRRGTRVDGVDAAGRGQTRGQAGSHAGVAEQDGPAGRGDAREGAAATGPHEAELEVTAAREARRLPLHERRQRPRPLLAALDELRGTDSTDLAACPRHPVALAGGADLIFRLNGRIMAG